jgi:hypothetical protein
VIRHLTTRRAACAVLAAAALLTGCSSDGEPVAAGTSTTEEPSPTPSPTPTWKLRPVKGERTAAVVALGGRPVLGLGDDPDPDQAAIDAAVDQVGDWLDAHLDALQRSGSGELGDVMAKGLANKKQRRPVTTGLASPDEPVKSARYVMSVYHDGTPRYLTTRVEVTHDDDSTSGIGMVFTVGEDGSPTLTMFGPEPKVQG